MRYAISETVRAPAARVWELLVDVEGWPAWTESMREIKRLDDGPLAAGSRSRVTQPKRRPMVWTVTELEPMREFTWVAAQPGLSFEAVHRIDDAGDHVITTLEFIVTDPLLPRDGEQRPQAGRRAGLALLVTRPPARRTI